MATFFCASRPQKGLLGGMMEIPSTPWEAKLPRQIVGSH